MKVWIVSVGEPLPTDGENTRLRRMGSLAHHMSMKGQNVEWFSVSFDHYQKKQRCMQNSDICIDEKYLMHIIYTDGYRRNISFARVRHHHMAGKRIYEKMSKCEAPDIIIASMGPLEVSAAAVRYAKKYQVPVVVDVRDLWPDIYYEVVPKLLKPLITPYVWLCRHRLRCTMSVAKVIIGLSDAFLAYGLKYAGRSKKTLDHVFPIAYPNYNYGKYQGEFEKQWNGYGISRDYFIVVFIGSFSKQFVFSSIINAARWLENYQDIKFVLCGTGVQLDEVKRRASQNVICPGWINKEQLLPLLANAKLGIAPYVNSINFTMNTPNKFGEYLSAGLPILISVCGVMEQLLVRNECGCRYEDGRDLSKCIENYYVEKDKLALHMKNARKLYENKFNGDVIYDQMLEHLKKVRKGCESEGQS